MRLQALLVTSALAFTAGMESPASASQEPVRLNRSEIMRELSMAPDEPLWNFMAGLVYESAATTSTEDRGLARVGYTMALRSDPLFWRAAYQLGLMSLEDRDAHSAKRLLLQAAMAAPREPRILWALARASYCAGDMELALAAFKQAEKIQPADDEQELLTAALLAGSRQDQVALDSVLFRLPPPLRDAVRNRMIIPRQVLTPATEVPAKPQGTGVGMAVVDVVIIRRSEGMATSSGINLLDALTLQFGSNLLNRSWSSESDTLDPALSTSSVSSQSGVQLTIPSVTYSLNLANARGSSSRIEERPTLLVYDGTESRFFNGGTLTFSTDGQLNSSSQTREVGLTLSVKPTFISSEVVNLAVNVTLENFLSSPPAGTFRQAVQTEKSSTQIAADVKFGQTLLVSAGSSRKASTGSSRVPVLGELPIVGGIFAARNESQQNSDLLVLLSLRRVTGQHDRSYSALEEQELLRLRAQLFPDLVDGERLEPEVRQLFYRINNPVRDDLKGYLGSLTDPTTLKRIVLAERARD